MFKESCPRCRNKINKKYDFCPFCGQNLKFKRDAEDYGILGKSDSLNEFTPESMFGGSFFDKMLDRAMKMLEKQMKTLGEQNIQNIQPSKNIDIQFYVNGKRVIPERVQSISAPQQEIQIAPNNGIKLTREKADRFAKLPKKEPKSKVRRFSKKLIYELSVPGVKNINDILVNQLESSIEIKALSNDSVYMKTLNIKLPVLGYKLENENLILELQTK